MRVLVVDDEPSILRSTLLLLEDLGHEAMGVNDVARVVPALRDFAPDVLLQDIRMPHLDVAALVHAVQADEHGRNVRILLWSASPEAEDIAAALDVRLLEKPFKPAELARQLNEAASFGREPGLVAK